MIERTIFAKSEIQITVSSKYMRPPIYIRRPSWGGNKLLVLKSYLKSTSRNRYFLKEKYNIYIPIYLIIQNNIPVLFNTI